MAFVNEYISEEDVKKYGIKEFDDQNFKGHCNPHWTVDKERDIYLRYMYNDREEHANRWTFAFYWKESMIMVDLDTEGGGEWRGAQWRHYKLWHIKMPELLNAQKEEIFADLKEALVAYSDLGVLSSSTQHTAIFDF